MKSHAGLTRTMAGGAVLLSVLAGCESTAYPPFPGPLATSTAPPSASATPTETPTPTATPTGELPTATATPTGDTGLGRRLFSFNPATSRFQLVGVLGLELVSKSVQGFLELEAGPADPIEGTRSLTLIDASPYIEIVLDTPIGDTIVCIELLTGSRPAADLGELACGPSDLGGLDLVQDHNITDVDPTCETGTPDTNILHAGVCNGVLQRSAIHSDDGPGAAAIGDPDTLQETIQVASSVEQALPCGDEQVEKHVNAFALVTGLSRATILDQNNFPGRTLQDQRRGEPFDCGRWTEEDGPGKFVFVGPLIDYDVDGPGNLLPIDALSVFELDD